MTPLAGFQLDAALNNVATMASVALALLALFTTLRGQQYQQDRSSGLGPLTKAALAALLLDIALAAITFGACAAMWTLFEESFSLSHWADREHATRSLFVVMYIGFVGLLLYQLSLVGRRLEKHISSARGGRAGSAKETAAGAG